MSLLLHAQLVNHDKSILKKVFSLHLPSTTSVSALQQTIKAFHAPLLDEVYAPELAIWKLLNPIPIASDDEEVSFYENIVGINLPDPMSKRPPRGNGMIQRLESYKTLSRYWQNEPEEDHLHLIVQLPPPTGPSITGRKRKREDDELSVIEALTAKAPSLLAIPSEFFKITKNAVLCNRPFNHETIPITLLQEEFALFEDDCSLPPIPEMAILLHRLTLICSDVYGDEDERRTTVEELLNEYTELALKSDFIDGKTIQTDGHSQSPIMPTLIRKCKNESGNALFQVIGYYLNFVRYSFEWRHKTRLPSVLLTDCGPLVGIYGAVWDGLKAQVEPLHPALDFTVHYTDEARRASMASVLGAMLNAVGRLKDYYASLESSSVVSTIMHGFPYRAYYTDRDGSRIDFRYLSRIDRGKLVFNIESHLEGKQLCAKFTRKYCAAAHEVLSEKDLAPALIAVNEIAGGWMMVIMEHSSTFIPLDDSKFRKRPSRSIIQAEVAKVVKILHDHGFVHGDVRCGNILIDPNWTEQQESCKPHMIDFDWAGKEGETRYPLLVNNVSVRRPNDVVGGEKILKKHDTEMVAQLFVGFPLD